MADDGYIVVFQDRCGKFGSEGRFVMMRPPRPAGDAAGIDESTDQRFVDGRPDVLSWQSAPLEAPLTIAGEIRADLFSSTSGSDADWIVKLIDVYPDNVTTNWPMSG